MATNFPTSQDSLTNPTSSDTLDSPDHAAQHTNVNDAVEAIELALLDGAPFILMTPMSVSASVRPALLAICILKMVTVRGD